MRISDYILMAIESFGTIAYGVSGAMMAIQKRADFFGVVFLGCVTATGGGIIRDIMLGHFPPRIFSDAPNVILAVFSSIIVYFLARKWKEKYLSRERKIDTINNIFDSLGLGAFTVIGVQIAIDSGLAGHCASSVFMGMVTGIGGGLARDLIINEIPFVLKKRIYALATIAGGLIYYLAQGYVNKTIAVFAAVVVTFTIRMLATHYRWNLPAAI
ncbi:MAG: trimeric intracellular cation channel family protein [Oscillospiraceae bacterium]